LGRDREGGTPQGAASGFPPPLTPPHQGGGDGPIWREGAFRPNAWLPAKDDEALPDAPVVLARRRWLAERDATTRRPAPLGLRLEAGEAVADIAADLPRFALIELVFPKFSDGRPFSTARRLREKYGYAGELRAVGNVLSDQIPLMRRVGFDSFEVTHAPTRRALIEGRIPEVILHYQPASPAEMTAIGPRPWLRCTQPSSVASNGRE
jgi:phosphoadenosine phosphosulfate reductase